MFGLYTQDGINAEVAYRHDSERRLIRRGRRRRALGIAPGALYERNRSARETNFR